jgi:hypothetical protein
MCFKPKPQKNVPVNNCHLKVIRGRNIWIIIYSLVPLREGIPYSGKFSHGAKFCVCQGTAKIRTAKS